MLQLPEQFFVLFSRFWFLFQVAFQVCVVALFSVVWYFVGGWFNATQESGGSWTWAMIWESLVEFPWIPALYTGVFSTGLCLWLEVIYFLIVNLHMPLLNLWSLFWFCIVLISAAKII